MQSLDWRLWGCRGYILATSNCSRHVWTSRVRVAATYRFVQNTLAVAWAAPPDQRRGDSRTRSAHQTCSKAADAKSITNCNYRLSDEQEQQWTTIRYSSSLRDTQSASETPRSIPFYTLYISTIHLAQRSSPEGSLVHVLRWGQSGIVTKTEILCEVDQDIATLEARLAAKMNEAH